MGKALLTVAVALGLAAIADHSYNHAFYTDNILAMLRQISHGFGH